MKRIMQKIWRKILEDRLISFMIKNLFGNNSFQILHDVVFQCVFLYSKVIAIAFEICDLFDQVSLNQCQILFLFNQLLVLLLKVVLLFNNSESFSLQCLLSFFVCMHLLTLLHKSFLEVINSLQKLTCSPSFLFKLLLVSILMFLELTYLTFYQLFVLGLTLFDGFLDFSELRIDLDDACLLIFSDFVKMPIFVFNYNPSLFTVGLIVFQTLDNVLKGNLEVNVLILSYLIDFKGFLRNVFACASVPSYNISEILS